MGGWGGVAAAGQVVKQRVANLDRDSRLVGSLRGADLKDVDGAELVAQNRPAGRRLFAIERLEATAGERGDHERGGSSHDSSMRRAHRPIHALVMPPH